MHSYAPGYRGFLRFAKAVDLDLEPFQRKIARTILQDPSETVVLLPRGQGKSRVVGVLAVHHLLTTSRASVYLAAASREQAAVVFEYARDAAQHPALDGALVVRHLELRAPDGGRLRVVASDAPKLHGLTPTFAVVDELHAHRDDEVYLALKTAMLKRPGARMVTISTAGQGAESPLGRLRARALAQPSRSLDQRKPARRLRHLPRRKRRARLHRQSARAGRYVLGA
jgi:phage terminase large subunit-like protein